MKQIQSRSLKVIAALALTFLSSKSMAADEKSPIGYTDTPLIPAQKWHVHDINRPHPPVVTPGVAASTAGGATAPSDAIVLFNGTDLAEWQADNTGTGQANRPAGWKVSNGHVEVVAGAGGIRTKRSFGDMQLHLEWAEPAIVVGDSQHRGNSGVFLMGKYEIQILDTFHNTTYADGQTGAIYGQFPPLANASRPPGEWQTYDIFFETARFDGGRLVRQPTVTIVMNGILVQNHQEILGGTVHREVPTTVSAATEGPIILQDHGAPVRFRNIWIRKLQPRD